MAQPPPDTERNSWTMGKEYHGEYRTRMNFVKNAFNENALLKHASSLRGNVSCRTDDKFAVGNDNLVKKVLFEDGVAWIARLRMPPIELFDENGPRADNMHDFRQQKSKQTRYEMECEMDTMELVRSRTKIPIPQIFAVDFDDKNAIGFPYVLMEYIEGITAAELAATLPGEHEGMPDQFFDKFTEQVASVMFELANIRMPQIGCIHRARDSSGTCDFEVDKVIDICTGPYENASEFYNKYPTELASAMYGDKWRECDHAARFISAFERFNESEPPTTSASSGDGYGLVNYDLGPHNFIVDHDFNVLAVIDWDTVFAFPDEALYRVPYLMGTVPAVPGLVETLPACKARERRFIQFAEIVDRKGQELAERSNGPKMVFTKEGFCSKRAVAFRALVRFRQKQDWVNEEWIKGLDWLTGKSAQEVLDFYLRDI